MKKKNGVNYSRALSATVRRTNALARLQAQLEEGVKRPKGDEEVPLSPSDIKRIEREINILTERIK